MVEINDIVFTRGEDGNLIPQEVTLENLPDKPKVKLRPLTRGKLQEIYAKATSDNPEEKVKADSDIIKEGLVEPKLSEEQLNDIKPNWALGLTTAILSISLGVSQEEVGKQAKDLIKSQELELQKK